MSSRETFPAGTRRRILVVDDDPGVREDLAEVLRIEGGWYVETAMDGAAAIGRLNAEPRVDLLILDVQMPVMTGWDVLDWMRAIPHEQRVPVIVVTGTGLSEGAFGDAGVFAKGSPPLQLVERVRRTLDRDPELTRADN